MCSWNSFLAYINRRKKSVEYFGGYDNFCSDLHEFVNFPYVSHTKPMLRIGTKRRRKRSVTPHFFSPIMFFILIPRIYQKKKKIVRLLWQIWSFLSRFSMNSSIFLMFSIQNAWLALGAKRRWRRSVTPNFFFDNLHKGTIGDILAQYEKNR